ncbi:hypothetical protein AMYX_32900 [Anaeromyxobacter diazotrophicus]|uniref:ABC transporter domain-containing protein n=1 Tax=Anaeromyxobacter diazotrophicus TaxID=2590199 RepID=A0A7I9VR43_9BACT|nr:LysR substrate-binding domain-containing protein [Anaeromyxobacter diazotrophicus]GEJ58549.1 hypothetical protein AMYX_32900 [Anaeromyxobacter diazotrophicus]
MSAPIPDASGIAREAPAAGGPTPAVELGGAGRAFGRFRALSGVTLSVLPGERVALVGPSGAGKSTLLRLASGALAPTEGAVRVLGEEVARLGPRRLRALRARVGTVHQQLQLVPQASVLENVLMGRLGRRSALAVALGALRRREREEVAALLAEIGIAGKLDERVDRLSGGEQQRVAVARVLYQAPDLVVADEPFSSVDPERSRAVIALLLRAAEGRALLLSTHQLAPVLPHFPRVVGLREGRVLFDKRREEVTPRDLALLYQPEGATRAPEPRRVVTEPAGAPSPAELRVGASTTPGEHILPAAVAAFAAEEPQVTLRLAVKGTAEVLRDLAAGRVELAFVGAREERAGLHFEDFAEDEIALVAAASFAGLPEPLHPAAVARLPRVDREPSSATRAIAEAQLAAMGAPLDPGAAVLEAGSLAALVEAVSAGLGVGFASRRSVARALAQRRVRLVAVEGVQIPRRFFVAWRRDAALSGPAARFLALARRAAGGGGP